MAVCRVDGEPLVSTMAFIYKEFVCVVCGRTYGWLDPEAVDPTPELEKRGKELRGRWEMQRAEDQQSAEAAYDGDWVGLSGREQRDRVAAEWVKRHA